jgi:CheY-like chemotaxis protein
MGPRILPYQSPISPIISVNLVGRIRRTEAEPPFRAALTEKLPHIILADSNLPHFSGRRALQISRELCPLVPFLFVTGARMIGAG